MTGFFDKNPQFTQEHQLKLKAEAAARKQERALARKQKEKWEEEQRFGKTRIALKNVDVSLTMVCTVCKTKKDDVILGCCPDCQVPRKPDPRREYRPDGVYYFNEENKLIHSTNRKWLRELGYGNDHRRLSVS